MTSDEIQEMYNDDLSGVGLAGSKKQIVYDEGTDASGLTIAIDEDGYGVAKITEGGYTSTVFSEDPIRDGSWHHLVVTFGDLPNVFKMYVTTPSREVLSFMILRLYPCILSLLLWVH